MKTIPKKLAVGIWLVLLGLLQGCGPKESPNSSNTEASVIVMENGKRIRRAEKEALAGGYTIIDLSDSWAPFLFSERDTQTDRKVPNAIRTMVTTLSAGKTMLSPTLAEAKRQLHSRVTANAAIPGNTHLAVYGISPNFTVLQRRLDNEVKRSCFSTVQFDRIRRFTGTIAYRKNPLAAIRSAAGRVAAQRLRSEMNRLGTVNPMQVPGNWQAALEFEALVEIQKQLVCERLLQRGQYTEGRFDYQTHQAVADFEQKNRIMGFGVLEGETLSALKTTPLERLHQAFVRVLTERVIDAAAIVETALAKKYTAVVLREMGIEKAGDTVRFLNGFASNGFRAYRVGIRLPALPTYYQQPLDLSVEIDRGDVWYDYPFAPDGAVIPQPRKEKPRLTLYILWKGDKIPLLKIPTTIGGWQKELTSDGKEILRYKNSPPGRHVWRRIVAGPVWIPPPTTPSAELLKNVRYAGRYVKVVDYDRIGPWYGSAYGLVAAFHEVTEGDATSEDIGIRTHGTYDYNAIMNRYSHGCHRLPNHLAVRLFSFILRHSPHRRVGHLYRKAAVSFSDHGHDYTIRLNDRGYTYELLRPIPVTVLQGTIIGKRRSPPVSSSDQY